MLQKTGNNLKNKGIYSDSISLKCMGCTKIVLENVIAPGPIIKSFKIYPIKILPKHKIIKGKAIAQGASCT